MPEPAVPEPDATVVLAIETSQRGGGVAVRDRHGEALVEPLSPRKRHDDDLVPAVRRLFAAAALAPRDLDAVGVSVGPGGFTGLRISVSCAKMLALSLGLPVVAVPSALVVAKGTDTGEPDGGRCLVALAAKRETFWATTVEPDGGVWRIVGDGGGLSAPATVDLAGVSVVIGDEHLPDAFIARCAEHGLPLVAPRFDPAACLAITERELRAGHITDPFALAPIYAREPEAVRLWDGGAP